jgi:hypothetical protein
MRQEIGVESNSYQPPEQLIFYLKSRKIMERAIYLFQANRNTVSI